MNPVRFPVLLLTIFLISGILFFSSDPKPEGSGVPLPVYPSQISTNGESGDLWFCVGPTEEIESVTERKIIIQSFSKESSSGRVTVADDLGNDIEREILLLPGQSLEIRPGQSVPNSKWAGVTVEIPKGQVLVQQEITGEGFDSEPCMTTAADSWYVPWSSTSRPGNKASLILYNPFQAPAVADLHFVGDVGRRETLDSQGVVVPSRSLIIFDLTKQIPDSAVISSTVEVRVGQIVVGRMQHVESSSKEKFGGMDLAYGSIRPANKIFLTGHKSDDGSNLHVAILNPNDGFIEVEVEVFGNSDFLLEPRKVALRAFQRQVLKLDIPDQNSFGVEVRSLDGEPLVASLINILEVSSDNQKLLTGVTTRSGVALGSTGWKFSIDDAVKNQSFLSVFNPSLETISTLSFSIEGKSLPREIPDLIELDALEFLSFLLPPGDRITLNMNSTTPVIAGLFTKTPDGISEKNGLVVSGEAGFPPQ